MINEVSPCVYAVRTRPDADMLQLWHPRRDTQAATCVCVCIGVCVGVCGAISGVWRLAR